MNFPDPAGIPQADISFSLLSSPLLPSHLISSLFSPRCRSTGDVSATITLKVCLVKDVKISTMMFPGGQLKGHRIMLANVTQTYSFPFL